MSTAFLLTSLIVVVSPGTAVLYTMAAGLSRGARASVIAAIGCTLGIIPHMVAAITGLAALLHTSAVAFQTLKYVGVAYLLLIAWRTLNEKGALTVREVTVSRSPANVIVSAILVNILNLVELSAVFMLLTLVIFVVYGIFAAGIRKHVIARPRVLTWMRRIFAGAFVALGARLAFTDR
ncbi:MAG: LysE family translocator [Chloroflexi bacterium]|nr:MAG: LysE family translocator [Chloroflexota bacterium]